MHSSAQRPRPLRIATHFALLVLLTLTAVFPLALATPQAMAATLAAGFGPEGFDNGLPQGWSVLPANGPGWAFNDPGARQNQTGSTGGFAIADSDKAGQVAMDTELRTPAFDLSGATGARLSFNTLFQAYAQSTADIDYSLDGGTTWTNMWRQTVGTRGQINLNLPEATLNQTNVMLRFRYYQATFAWFWQLDAIQVTTQNQNVPITPAAPTGLTATIAGSEVTLAWTDASSNETGFRVERSTDGGASWTPLSTVPANSTSATSSAVACGANYSYRVLALLAGGSDSAPSNSANLSTPACAGLTSLNESFTTTNTPAGWTVTPINGAAWLFNNPKARANETGGAGGFAIADSDNAGAVAMDTVLRTPSLDLSGSPAVELSFKTAFKLYQTATADVDVSSDNGANWTNVWRKTADFNGAVRLDLSAQAGGKSNVLVRFRYHNANFEWYWQVDDVQIQGITAPAAPTSLTATAGGSGEANLAWNGGGAPRFALERAPAAQETWTKIADLTNGTSTFIDQTVASGTSYRYRVQALNSAGASGYSNIASYTAGDRSVRTFDVTISLYRDSVTPELRAQYDRILRYFADSVYEMSNGAHKLKNVKIYLGAANKDTANVVWVASCHPSANVSGYGREGWQVNMCDVFSNQTYLQSEGWAQVGGFGSLGHEWGHYFYGLYDEYRGSVACDPNKPTSPCSGDTPVPNALMQNGDYAGNVPEAGLNGDLTWANFSTAINDTRNTAQFRAFGASSWDTLVRSATQDPRDGQRNRLPTRLYWPELAAVAPAAGQAPRIDLTGDAARAAARSDLTLTWLNASGQPLASTGSGAALAQASDGVVRQFVIDRSARIGDAQLLDSIKAAVSQELDAAELGDSIGLIAFDGTATVVQTPLKITSEADRTTLKNALAGIMPSASFDANLSAALQAALSNLPGGLNDVVYLITGGAETIGDPAFAQVGAYQNAGVPLFIFAYASTDDAEATLQQLAAATEGRYRALVSRGFNGLEAALTSAHQATSPVLDIELAQDELIVEANATANIPFVVDATLGAIELEVFFPGTADGTTLSLRSPSNATTTLVCETSGTDREAETFCSAEVDGPAVGTWTLQITAGDTGFDLFYWIGGTAAEGAFAYSTTVTGVDGNVVSYPQPIIVRAMLQREFNVSGLVVKARLVAPDGEMTELPLRDDGVAPDAVADDGEYTGIFDYTGDGEYAVLVDFDNSAGTAKTTLSSFQLQRGANPPAPELITTNFQRHGMAQITVRGWQDDDHAEEIEQATTLPIDNTPVAGRIDFADDGDTFKLTVPQGANGNIVVRIADFAMGMDPYLFIYSEDGSIDQSAYLDSDPANNAYLTAPLNLQPGQVVYITVAHYDEQATTGYYSLSAGEALPLEVSRSSPPKLTQASFRVWLPLTVR